ncbi:RebB family R body protein [Sulfidibacter corallicola]|uniref:RebB family R body protein n=1 Tax=Sulfidibacter corallicola TaxID=2818388 RepID=A0A8A4TKM9_SULCO|nr:RebB family R body protein [Sulfidibacter corallicola]
MGFPVSTTKLPGDLPAEETGTVAQTPAQSVSQLYQATSLSLALAAQNAAAIQMQNNILAQAATAANVQKILSLNVSGNRLRKRSVVRKPAKR